MRICWLFALTGCFDFVGLEQLYHPGSDLSSADLSGGNIDDLAAISDLETPSGADLSGADLMSLPDLAARRDLAGADLRPAPQPSFASQGCLLLGSGLMLESIAVFDGDHANGPDLVVGAYGGKQVYPLYGNAAGTGFTPGTPISIVNNVSGVAGGDFDGDGLPDLLATTSANLYFMRGTALAVYASPAPIAAGTQLNAVVAGAFDLDTHLDAAWVDGSVMKAYIGTMGAASGFGSLQIPSTSATNSVAVAAIDLNGDTRLDLVVADGSGHAIDTFLNDGAGTFTASTSISLGGQAPLALAVGDLNGDGVGDLAAVTTTQALLFYINNGSNSYQAAPSLSASPSGAAGIVIADFNGDGFGDVGYAGSVANNFSVLTGKGDGTFQPVQQNFPTCTGPFGLVSADFNGDLRPDVAISCYTTVSDVCLFLNTT